jgi:hypothetical protein
MQRSQIEIFSNIIEEVPMKLADLSAPITYNLTPQKNTVLSYEFDFLNPALALLGQALKKSPIGQKLDFANHPYLCKGL